LLGGIVGRSGSLGNGIFTLKGVASGGPVGTYEGIKTLSTGETKTLTASDFYGNFNVGGPVVLPDPGAGTAITNFTTTVTVPLLGTKSITTKSELYSNN
jgi:hypothetical protein